MLCYGYFHNYVLNLCCAHRISILTLIDSPHSRSRSLIYPAPMLSVFKMSDLSSIHNHIYNYLPLNYFKKSIHRKAGVEELFIVLSNLTPKEFKEKIMNHQIIIYILTSIDTPRHVKSINTREIITQSDYICIIKYHSYHYFDHYFLPIAHPRLHILPRS